MSTFVKSINNSQILGVAGGALNVNSDVTFVGKVYTTNVANCFNLQYGDVTSLQTMVPEINTNYSNTAIGMNTLPLLTSGYGNTSLGSYALNKATNATQNTALGAACLYALTSGQYNTAVGNDCLLQNLTGNNNTGIGKGCMFGGGGETYSFSNNVGAGHQALGMLETGNFNVGVGTQAGNGLLSGSYNTCIGCTSNVNAGSCTYSTSLGYGSIANASHQVMLGTITENVYIPNTLTTQGLVYEVVGTAGQTSNALTLNYSLSGLVNVGTMITLNATLAVTNIPTDTTKSYTFSVAYQQTATRFYIATVQFQDTGSAYITNGGSSGFVSPLFNGGAPALTGINNCIIIQQFTIISVAGSRRIISSISCCSL